MIRGRILDKNISLFTIINTIAIVIIPILAVVIGQYLQNRAKCRDDKMQIFKTLMTYRFFGWTNETVCALNVIEIVFSKDKKVIKQWKTYKDRLTIENPTQTDLQKIETEKNKLLEEMAKSLNYPISWETIQNPYLPQGMIHALVQKQTFQNNQVQLMEIAKNMFVNNVNPKKGN